MSRRSLTVAALLAGALPSVRKRNAATIGRPTAPAPRVTPPGAAAGVVATGTANVVVVEMPGLRLASEANTRAGAHWAKSKRTQATRAAVAAAVRGILPPPLPLRVCITRMAPAMLDDDNAASSAKATRDAVAAWLGLDDADPRVAWRVSQLPTKRGVYGVRVTVAHVDGRAVVVTGERVDEVALTLRPWERDAFVRALATGAAVVSCGGVDVFVEVTGWATI